MTNIGDAVGSGIVASLGHHGGNITGDTFYVTELVPKRLQLLKDAIPGVRRVAISRIRTTPQRDSTSGPRRSPPGS